LVDAGMLCYPEEIAFRSTWIHRNQLETLKKALGGALTASAYCAPAFQQILGATGARIHGCVCVTDLTSRTARPA
jgi:hypothetical protein